MEMLTDKRTKNKHTNKRNYTNFEKNLAMMVIYLIGQSVFELSGENVDGQTKTDKQTELHQFQKEPSYDGDLSPCQV